MSGKKSKLLRFLALILALLLVFAIVGYFKVRAIKAEAVLLAETGKTTMDFLKEYGNGIKHNSIDEIMACYAKDYQQTEQRFWEPVLVSEKDDVTYYRWQQTEAVQADAQTVKAFLQEQLNRWGDLRRSKFKLAKIEEAEPGRAVALSTMWLTGKQADGRPFETKILFRIGLEDSDYGWQIVSHEMIRGSTVVGNGEGFTDITEQTGIAFKSIINPDFNTPEWDLKTFAIAMYSSGGVSAADYDDDGYTDLLFTNGGPFELYRNNGDGSFTNTTETAGLPTDLNGSNTALFLDLDNDGDKDLFLSMFTAANRVYENNGDGTFTDRTPEGGISYGLAPVAAAADYDNDGDLDIYLGRYLDPRVNLPTTLFYTRNSAGNGLLRNDGNFQFTDVTEQAGVRDGGLTLGVAWADYDRDGDADLYVANDFGRNALFRNNGDGTFTDVAFEKGALDIGYGMSASWGDANGDGKFDIYVSNVHSGQRWFGHAPTLYNYLFNSLRQGTLSEDRPVFEEIQKYFGDKWHEAGDHIIKGNSLMIAQDDGTFTDVSVDADVNPFGWFWGSSFLDFDNDGLQDLYAANGFISAHSKDDL